MIECAESSEKKANLLDRIKSKECDLPKILEDSSVEEESSNNTSTTDSKKFDDDQLSTRTVETDRIATPSVSIKSNRTYSVEDHFEFIKYIFGTNRVCEAVSFFLKITFESFLIFYRVFDHIYIIM